MSTPITQLPKPGAEQYKNEKKLFLVPNFMMPPGIPDEGQKLREDYWSEVRENITNLERSLGSISKIFHEPVASEDEKGMEIVEQINPKASSFIKALHQSNAKLEALEDQEILQESMEWSQLITTQHSFSSKKVQEFFSTTIAPKALEGYRESTENRSKNIIDKISSSLQQNEVGILFIREDHGFQFPADIKIFYVAPRALDALKRWIEDQMRAPSLNQEEEPEPDDKSDEA